jgi:hypothetical protein
MVRIDLVRWIFSPPLSRDEACRNRKKLALDLRWAWWACSYAVMQSRVLEVEIECRGYY